MKVTICKPVEYEACLIEVDSHIRYAEDITYQIGDSWKDCDPDNPECPCFNGAHRWKPIININTGYIINWPGDVQYNFHVFAKVCDEFACKIGITEIRGADRRNLPQGQIGHCGDYVHPTDPSDHTKLLSPTGAGAKLQHVGSASVGDHLNELLIPDTRVVEKTNGITAGIHTVSCAVHRTGAGSGSLRRCRQLPQLFRADRPRCPGDPGAEQGLFHRHFPATSHLSGQGHSRQW